MELNVLEKKKQRLVFELPGTDHTLCNALKNELLKDEDVTVATYAIKHPLMAVPKFIIETKKGEAQQAFLDAIARLKKECKSFTATLAKA